MLEKETQWSCPKCGERQVRVMDSRSYIHNRIRRRRKCLSCKHRFSTVELHVEDIEDFKIFESFYNLKRLDREIVKAVIKAVEKKII
jgi:transcriptional repressor NrdR